jgi:hypothetical protein
MYVRPLIQMAIRVGSDFMFRIAFFIFICLGPLLLQAVKAGDEDMLTPYAEFDPETGFFLPPSLMTSDPQQPKSRPPVSESISDINKITKQESNSDNKSNRNIILATIFAILVSLGYWQLRKSK